MEKQLEPAATVDHLLTSIANKEPRPEPGFRSMSRIFLFGY
jgi:hypothetical protein